MILSCKLPKFKIELVYKKASQAELHAYMAEVLPTYDRDRVHTSDIKKLVQWYNILISNGITEFVAAEEETATEE